MEHFYIGWGRGVFQLVAHMSCQKGKVCNTEIPIKDTVGKVVGKLRDGNNKCIRVIVVRQVIWISNTNERMQRVTP